MPAKSKDKEEKAAPAAKEPKPPKVKLTPEQRTEAVRAAREKRVSDFFEGHTFEYIGAVTTDGYVDITGNKGRAGHEIKNKKTGEVWVIGPTALKKGIEEYKAITGYKKPEKAPKTPAAEEAAAV